MLFRDLSFFRQTHGQLVETVPPDASFIFQINDNETFVKTSTQLLPSLNDILSMDAFPGFEFFMDKFPNGNGGVIISCHQNDDVKSLLFSTKITESMFKQLLKTLRIDARNFIPFDNAKIYSFGTHYKKYNFIFHNNFFTVSEDIELLKKSIVQLKHPRNLLSNKSFSSLYDNIILKNNKQNWLILNNKKYFEDLSLFLSEPYRSLGNHWGEISEWSAFLIKFNDKEINLSGYALNLSTFFRKFDNQQAVSGISTQIIPSKTPFYVAIKTPDPDFFAQNFNTLTEQKYQNAVNYFQLLKPVANYSFSLQKDTITYHYLALELDTNKSNIRSILPDSLTANDEIKFQQYTIFKSKSGSFNPMLSATHNYTSMKYFTEYQGCYIFSDTTVALQYYLQSIQQNNIGNQPLYKFSKSNLPTLNNYEFCFIASENENIRKYSSEIALRTNIGREIQIFSYSFSAPERGYVPINIYLKLR